MHAASIIVLFLLVLTGVVLTCGAAGRRVAFLLSAFVGVPLGFTLDWNELGTGPALWLLSGTVATLCLSLTDTFHVKQRAPGDVRQIARDE